MAKRCGAGALRLKTRAAAPDRCANWPYVASGGVLTWTRAWASVFMDASMALLFNCEFGTYTRRVTQQWCRTFIGLPLVAIACA